MIEKYLVILVEFPDKRFKPEYDIQWFDNLLNRDNYKTELFNGSVRDYFRSQSNGKLNLTFEIFSLSQLNERPLTMDTRSGLM